jgi:hypothetical protein
MALSSWNESTPAGSRNAAEIDDIIADELKPDLRERLYLGGHLDVRNSTEGWKHVTLQSLTGRFSVWNEAGNIEVFRVEEEGDGGSHTGLKQHRYGTLYLPGTVVVGAFAGVVQTPFAGKLVEVRIVVNVEPTGANVVLDVWHGATGDDPINAITDADSIFGVAGVEPVIAAGANEGATTTFDSGEDTVVLNDLWKVNVDSCPVGANAASDLTVTLKFEEYVQGF